MLIAVAVVVANVNLDAAIGRQHGLHQVKVVSSRLMSDDVQVGQIQRIRHA
ncbi:hypothetical protein ACS0ZG_04700 [Burkholderia gladioli]|uniref:hypothetical protein n=1 Tax=Burkholderia gladioli TaxID=28095 RepID=UPI002FE2F2A3